MKVDLLVDSYKKSVATPEAGLILMSCNNQTNGDERKYETRLGGEGDSQGIMKEI